MVAFEEDDPVAPFVEFVANEYSQKIGIQPDIYAVQAAAGAGLLLKS